MLGGEVPSWLATDLTWPAGRTASGGMVATEHERLSLSVQERKILADLEARLLADDPRLQRRLGGGRAHGIPRRWWIGVVLVMVGAVILIGGFTVALWLGLAGAALMGSGLGLALPHARMAGGRVARRWHNNDGTRRQH